MEGVLDKEKNVQEIERCVLLTLVTSSFGEIPTA